MDPVRGVLMVREVVLNHISKSCGQSKLKNQSYKARSCTVRLWVKHGFKVSNKMISTLVTLTLFKVHVNPFFGPIVVRGRSKRKIKSITNFIWHKISLKPVIQIDFSSFCSSVLFDFTLLAQLMASKITRWIFLKLRYS